MIVQYIPRKLVIGGYGLLYNWFAASKPQTITYGYLYNWYAATDARNLANTGWHVPSSTELATLDTYLGGGSVSGGKLKETGTTYWLSPNTGATNESGFNGRGAGERASDGTFTTPNQRGFFWSTTEYLPATGYYRYLLDSASTFPSGFVDGNKKRGFSVRLLKDSTSLTNGQTGTYTGNDGRVYATICIGTQEWLSENLTETKYRNGDFVAEVTDNTAWSALTTGARCAYDNTGTNIGSGNAISSSDDWVVPSQTQWQSFFNTLDTYEIFINGWPVLGTKLRESGWNHWYDYFDEDYGINGTNDYGFTLRGAGVRNGFDGSFDSLKVAIQIWSSTELAILDIPPYIDTNPYAVFTSFKINEMTNSNGTKASGYSVRLLYTGVGTPTSYVGNDGKTYPVVQIGSQYWMAANLKETQYRDGSSIPEVTDNTEWAELTTGALCAYNNDWNNV